MSEIRIIVDHLKLEHSGLIDTKGLFKLINQWFADRNYQKKEDKNHEQDLPGGKFIEYEISPWKKLQSEEYFKYIIKIKALFKNLKQIEAAKDKKKTKIDQGEVLIYFDGILEHDCIHKWESNPLFIFIRTMYDKFIFKMYTERFEQRLVHQVHSLYNEIEKFLNTSRYYKVVSRAPHF